MDDTKEIKALMHPTTYLGLDEESKNMDRTQYAMIGPFLYLTASIPDIMFSVCLCARFQKEPRKVHLIAVKRIFIYHISTPNLGLCFKRGKDFKLSCYLDDDYARNKLERQITNRS